MILRKILKKDTVPIYMCKKGPGPKLKNSRNYAYSACCDYNYNQGYGGNAYQYDGFRVVLCP